MAGGSPRPLALTSILCAATALALDPNALPTGGQITAGRGAISQSGGAMTITQQTDRMVANWGTFNIGQNASVTFRQPGSSSVALNRILDQNPSQIYGSLSANGQVFLINAAGIYFGPTARVDVGGLVASSLNIRNDDFLSGRYSFTKDGVAGGIINQGTIHAADGGYVAFISPRIVNEGTVAASGGTVAMAAGDKVSLDFTGDRLVSFTVDKGAIAALIENKGLISAGGGVVILSAKAADSLTTAVVNNSGIIEARTLANKEGRILLLSDADIGETVVGGTLDASAPLAGNGGFIETSGAKVTIRDGLRVTTDAPNGTSGTWLIDPKNFTIAAYGGDMTGAQVSAALTAGNLEIRSTSGAANGAGDIRVDDGIAWYANKLTLNAGNSISINRALYGWGSAQLALYYGQAAPAAGNTATYSVGAPVNLPAGRNFFTKLGSDGAVKTFTVITSLGSAGSTTTTDLQGMAGDPSGNYALGTNIDATATRTWNSGAGFAPVGAVYPYFTGTFDGLGHTVSNLTINRPDTLDVGLFGSAMHASISNVGLIGGSVTGNYYVGALVGSMGYTNVTGSFSTGDVSGSAWAGGLVGLSNAESTIANSHATGVVTALGFYAGGLAGGSISNSNVSNSYATGTVTGYGAGGLVGMNGAGGITNSFATGTVLATGNDAGGLVGWNIGPISNSYATGTVAGSAYAAGGLVGENSRLSGIITNSYATGAVINTLGAAGGLAGANWFSGSIVNSYSTGLVLGPRGMTGGLVGTRAEVPGQTSTVTGSFWNTETSRQSSSAGGTGKTTAQMKNLSTYADAGWDIDRKGGTGTVWRIYDGYTYPLLRSFLTPVSMNNLTATYNGSNILTGVSYAWGSPVDTGMIYGSAFYTADSRDAGQRTVTLGGLYSSQQGYDIVAPSTVTILPAPLFITANGDSRTYRDIGYTGGNGVTYTGFMNGDFAADLGGVLRYGGTSQGAWYAGTYSIIPYGLTSSNYTITYGSGSLQITGSPVNTSSFTSVQNAVSGNSMQGSSSSGVFFAAALGPGGGNSIMTGLFGSNPISLVGADSGFFAP